MGTLPSARGSEDALYERALHAPLQAVLEANLAPGGEVLIADPGRPPAIEFAARLEAAGWRVGMEPPPGEVEVFLYRLRRG